LRFNAVEYIGFWSKTENIGFVWVLEDLRDQASKQKRIGFKPKIEHIVLYWKF
jgi:hypothetical protein